MGKVVKDVVILKGKLGKWIECCCFGDRDGF